MRAERAWLSIALLAAGWPSLQVRAEGWVEPLSQLRAAPVGLTDARQPLAARIAFARELGQFGPEDDAVPLLLEALGKNPPPALREEILLAIARRAPPAAAAPLAALLADDEHVTPALAGALAAIGNRSALTALVYELARPHPAVVERALLDAGPAAAAPLAAALTTPLDVPAAKLLARLGSDASDAEPALYQALRANKPALRAAAATALGALGHPSSAPALQAALSDDEPRVVQAVLGALVHVATPQQAPALAALFAHAGGALRTLALRALAHADAQRALPALARALAGGDAGLRAQARDVIESAEAPDPSFVPLLASLLRSELREATASALARVAHGAGVPALLAAGERSPDAAQRVARALAIALRRFGDEIDSGSIARARALLHSLAPGERRLLLCALARDHAALGYARAALTAANPSRRAAAAQALTWLDDRAAGELLRAALLRERDGEAARRMSEAALALGVALAPHALLRLMQDAESAPEAMQLAASGAGADPSHTLAIFLRRTLSSSDPPRTRAAAALALARMNDAGAVPALSAALLDASPRVRLAAVRALSALGGRAALRALTVHARVERDPLVRHAAREEAGHAGVAQPLAPAGTYVLELRLIAPGAVALRPYADVLLLDGRWLRVRALAGGELIVADLPLGSADVRAVD